MKKVKVIKPFYCKKDTMLYVDEDRCKELSSLGYVEEENDNVIETASLKQNGERKVLSDKGLENSKKECLD